MTSNRMNLAAIGAFVLIAVASLVYVLALLAGRTGSTDAYYTVYSNVTGIKFGSQVFYEGYAVGQVTGIKPMQQDGQVRFRVDLAVTEGWRIPEDSVAQSSSTGLLAPQVISIRAGKSPTMLSPGALIAPGQGLDLFSTVSGAAGSVNRLTNEALLPLFDNLNQQISAIGGLLNGDVRAFVGNANLISASVAKDLPLVLRDARTASSNVASLTQQLNQTLTPERIARLDRILGNADTTTASLAKTSAALEQLTGDSSEDLRVAVRELRYTSESLSRHAESISQNLDSATRNLQELSRRLKQNPGLLIRNSRSDEAEEKAP